MTLAGSQDIVTEGGRAAAVDDITKQAVMGDCESYGKGVQGMESGQAQAWAMVYIVGNTHV